MKILGLDGRKYFDFGIGTYVQQIVKQASTLRPDFNGILYTSPEDAGHISVGEPWTKAVVPFGKYSVSELTRYRSRVRRDRIALFHSPHYTLPFGLHRRSVVTVHDIMHLRFPQYFAPHQRAYAYLMIRHAVMHAGAVATDSNFTRSEILSLFPHAESRIHVIHLGVGEEFTRVRDRELLNGFRKRYDLREPFVLFVGNDKPHKGLNVLVRAVHALVNGHSDVQVAVVGGEPGPEASINRYIAETGISSKVRFLGRIPSTDLVLAYNAAAVCACPSEYEGFGLPALEAMACGTPVVVSNAKALAEVAGDAAVSFPCRNERALRDALAKVLTDEGLRNELVRKGMERAKQFSWTETARKTFALYETLMA